MARPLSDAATALVKSGHWDWAEVDAKDPTRINGAVRVPDGTLAGCSLQLRHDSVKGVCLFLTSHDKLPAGTILFVLSELPSAQKGAPDDGTLYSRGRHHGTPGHTGWTEGRVPIWYNANHAQPTEATMQATHKRNERHINMQASAPSLALECPVQSTRHT